MAGSLFGKLSLEEGDSANSLEVLEMKLGVEGRKQKSPFDQFSRARSSPTVSQVEENKRLVPQLQFLQESAGACGHAHGYRALCVLQSHLLAGDEGWQCTAACDIQDTYKRGVGNATARLVVRRRGEREGGSFKTSLRNKLCDEQPAFSILITRSSLRAQYGAGRAIHPLHY